MISFCHLQNFMACYDEWNLELKPVLPYFEVVYRFFDFVIDGYFLLPYLICHVLSLPSVNRLEIYLGNKRTFGCQVKRPTDGNHQCTYRQSRTKVSYIDSSVAWQQVCQREYTRTIESRIWVLWLSAPFCYDCSESLLT